MLLRPIAQEILESTPGKDVNWPWFMHLMGEVVSKNLRNFDSIIYTEDFHSPLRAMRKLPRKVAKKDKFQAVLRHNLVRRVRGPCVRGLPTGGASGGQPSVVGGKLTIL